MTQHHARLSGGPRVTIGSVRSDLLVSRVDELDGAALKRTQHRNVRVPAKAEHVLHAARLEIPDQLVRNKVLHFDPLPRWSPRTLSIDPPCPASAYLNTCTASLGALALCYDRPAASAP